MKIILALEKQNYLDDTQNTLISDRVSVNLVVFLLISFNEKVFGTPTRCSRCVFVLYSNSQKIMYDFRFIHLSMVLNKQEFPSLASCITLKSNFSKSNITKQICTSLALNVGGWVFVSTILIILTAVELRGGFPLSTAWTITSYIFIFCNIQKKICFRHYIDNHLVCMCLCTFSCPLNQAQ